MWKAKNKHNLLNIITVLKQKIPWYTAYMQKPETIVLTGDRPTGKLHLGHFVGSIKNRLKLQEENKCNYYMIADVQALTDNAENPDKVRSNVLEVALDNLACGLDPVKTTFFIQSQIPEIAELTVFFMNLVTMQRLGQNPTIKSEIREKGWNENLVSEGGENTQQKGTPAGFYCYPISQAADILTFKATVIPVGEDQKPMIEQTNEIADSFNRIYGETFTRVSHMVGDIGRLVGTDGNAKMSKSLGNTIYFSDTKEEIEKKVRDMYTDPNHVRIEDPGRVEGNVVFDYLTIFDPNQTEVEELKNKYRAGGLGDVVLKQRLTDVLDAFIAPIRERREYLAKDPKQVMQILEEGTKKARLAAAETLREVKQKMKIEYF
jgi:tryptophanyl-tRNA synthetase